MKWKKQRRGDVPCLHIDWVERPEGTWCDTPAAPDRGFSGVLGFCATLLSASDPPGTWAALDPFRRKHSISLQSPSKCCYHYSDRLRLSWCYWNAGGGGILLHLRMKKKKSLKNVKGRDIKGSRTSYFGSFKTGMEAIRCWRALSIIWIRWHKKTSIWSFDRFILTGQAYLPIYTFSVNCERGFGLSADKHAS